ncbi:mannose-6-phosphate isomerase, class I [Alkalihalobacillus sp. FSL W8-0930]
MTVHEPLFLKPVLQERIWGGTKLQTEFGYTIPSEHTGEAWVISAHPHGVSVVENGTYAGKSLKDLWENEGEIFNKPVSSTEEYPLLIKLLDAAEDLSVQVHPNDEFARNVEGVPYGKTECWYVVSAEEDSELILGHHAQSEEELTQLMESKEWDKLLRRVKVQAGDFVHVPSGTIHAIGAGIVILETQQSSDITYRVYDYERTDANGNKRELHVDRSIEVTTVPHQDATYTKQEKTVQDLTETKLVEDPYFTVYHWKLSGDATLSLTANFLQVSVIDGEGLLKVEDVEYPIRKGQHFILPSGITTYSIHGQLECMVSHT